MKKPVKIIIFLTALGFNLSLFATEEKPKTNLDIQPGFKLVGSLEELNLAFSKNNMKFRVKPGVYRVTKTQPDNKTLFFCKGSNNYFDMRGVTIEVDTKVYADMRGKVHSLSGYRILGNGNTFLGATFEDIGENPPYVSLAGFNVHGDDNTFKNCTFIVRGSKPYGYGELFGKGRPSKVKLQKHSAMSVLGDNTKIIGCKFYINTFGHAIHMHGAQNTLVKDTYIEGKLRNTNEILAEKSGPAFDLGFKDVYDRPIPKDIMLALAEDAIRTYTNGTKDGKERLTGDTTVINCTVKRMRSSIVLRLGAGKAIVEGCTVIEGGYPGHDYSVSSNSIIRNSKGDAANGPLLWMGDTKNRNSDVELELVDANSYSGNDRLALINGSGHKVKITKADGKPLKKNKKIYFGIATATDKADISAAKGIRLINNTAQEIVLTDHSENCTVTSNTKVTDDGKNNKIIQTKEQNQEKTKSICH